MPQEATGAGAAGQITAGIANNAAQVGSQRTGRTMNTKPTIRVAAGSRMTLIRGKDLWVKPVVS